MVEKLGVENISIQLQNYMVYDSLINIHQNLNLML